MVLHELGLRVTVHFMPARMYYLHNQCSQWSIYNLVPLISLSTEQFSLPPQLPPRNFTPSECKDCHTESVKTVEQNRVSIVETYLQRLQMVDISQYDMIFTISDLCHYISYYWMIYTIFMPEDLCYLIYTIMSYSSDLIRYDLYHDSLKIVILG